MSRQTLKLLSYGRKHCGKSRKCWFPAFCPFPTMCSKGLSFFMKGVESRRFVVKVENVVGKVENAGYQHFLLYLKCVRKANFSKERQKSLFCGKS